MDGRLQPVRPDDQDGGREQVQDDLQVIKINIINTKMSIITMNVYARCDSRIKSNLVNSFVTATTMPPTLTVALGLGWAELHATISLKSIVEHVGTFFFSFFAQVGNGHNWCSPYKQWQAQHGNDPYTILELQVEGKPWTSCGQIVNPCSVSKNLLHSLHKIEYHCSREIHLSFSSYDVQMSTIFISLLICRTWAT